MAERAKLGLQNYYFDGSIPIFTQFEDHNRHFKFRDFDWNDSDFNKNGDLLSESEDEFKILNSENQST